MSYNDFFGCHNISGSVVPNKYAWQMRIYFR